ncbi:DNA-binding NarL/FixJ family response regulator [Pseudomonas protegens]|uniref:response regulator n=1 Tax=Pseudomonas protegens TaxID=380021 RepID=UPI003512555B
MKVLIIEDNQLKREKIMDYLRQSFEVSIMEAASYNSGLTAAHDEEFDFMILDMSMPTFDRNESTQGGRFRPLAGRDIAAKLAKSKKLMPFVVLSGYKDFSVNEQTLSIDQIHDLLATLGGEYKGCIQFDSTELSWKEKLGKVMSELKC